MALTDNPRIIHAPMNPRRLVTTSAITQYDYGYLLLPEGMELPATYEIDFSNDEKNGTSLTVYGGAEGAEVPEELIRTGKDVYAFYYRVGEGYGKTEFTWRLPNHCRPSRDGETPTPTQQSSIDQLITRSNGAVESAEQSASQADQSARSAQTYANNAQISANNASASASQAEQSAQTASAKADSITGLTATATTLPSRESATVNYNPETGVMSFGIPKGKDGINGDDGYSPTVTITPITGGHRITITDANGEHSADVMDGDDYTLTAQDKQDIADIVDVPTKVHHPRITALNNEKIMDGEIIEVGEIPEFVDDPSKYSEYGIADTGWYVFVRINTKNSDAVSGQTTIDGADGYIANVGADHVDVAIRFEVASTSKTVTITWKTDDTEVFVFKAVDLAVRNLDYRTTFYVYDITPYRTWSYALTADATFVADKNYYILSDGEYVLAEVTVGSAVPANTYYNHSKLRFEGMARNVTYNLAEIVDCPIEIVLPEIPKNGYGAWFDIQMRYDGTHSCTLLPPEGVKIGTAQTQSQTKGVNIFELQYTDAGDVKMWTLLNTHSNIPS